MDTTLSSLSSTTIMAATLIRAISSPYSHDRSPLSEIEALERGALAVIVSFKNGHLSRRSSASSFLSLSTTFSTSSLLSSADVAAAAEKGVLKRGGDWVSSASSWLPLIRRIFFFFANPSKIFAFHPHIGHAKHA